MPVPSPLFIFFLRGTSSTARLSLLIGFSGTQLFVPRMNKVAFVCRLPIPNTVYAVFPRISSMFPEPQRFPLAGGIPRSLRFRAIRHRDERPLPDSRLI